MHFELWRYCIKATIWSCLLNIFIHQCFCYRGEVTVSAEDLSSFLKTAEILKVNGLSPEQNNSQQQSTVNPVSASTVFSQANLVTRTSNPKPNSNSSSSTSKQNSIHFTQNSSDKNLPEDSNVQTMLNPTDFMDLDMTCVKEVSSALILLSLRSVWKKKYFCFKRCFLFLKRKNMFFF